MLAVAKRERVPCGSRGRRPRSAAIVGTICVIVAGSATPALATAQPDGASAEALVLRATDLPARWAPSGQAGPCVNGGPAPNPKEPYCGNTPLPAQRATDSKFAKCLGVPVARLSLLTGVDEPGEPFTYSSATYTAPTPKAWQVPAMFRAAPGDALPQAQSLLMAEPSETVQRSDLQAFSNADFPGCYKIELAGPTYALVKLFLTHEGYEAAFTPLERVPVAASGKVATVRYDFQLLLKSPKKQQFSLHFRLVVMGANGVEEVLRFTSSSFVAVPAGVVDNAVSHLEGRLARDLQASRAASA